MNRTGRTPRQSQRVADELLTLCVLAATEERVCQVGRQCQRAFVICAEEAGHGDEDLALNLHGLNELALPPEREHQVAGRDERRTVVSTDDERGDAH